MVQVADLRPIPLFDGLADTQLAELVTAGEEVPIVVGREVFHEGDPADSWWVLVDGAANLFRHSGREDMLVGRMETPGQWAGGFRAWDEHGVCLATAVGVRPGRLLRVPATLLRQQTDTWFPFGGHLIAGLFHTARSIEATARQRESLVSLGKLAAGLAHELNNPAAAATRAVDALTEACDTLLSAPSRLAAEHVTAEQFTALEGLRQDRLAPSPRRPVEDPLALADREDALGTWLDDHGVSSSWLLAPTLAAEGVDVGWCEDVARILGPAALEPGMEWTASTYAVAALLTEVKESTRRISELVSAVRSYSQMDRASRQRVDLVEGLENTLVMLGHKLRDGIAVVRDYGEDVPRVEAYPGELNQVWTNLIDNAVDAMDGKGTLRIVTRADGGDAAVVEIADTGPGMSPEVAARAFEAFFTTKKVGQGTGLGLDVARRIVEDRHGGKIVIDSQPGRTLLRVRLPVQGRAG